jgi:tRNA acetyltransferase TAN1
MLIDMRTVVFFKVLPPIVPVSFVHRICKDAASSASRKQSRSVKRLTPMALMGKATEAGLGEVAQQVLAPHFHNPPILAKKVLSTDPFYRHAAVRSANSRPQQFAIRPNIRNHDILSRDSVIKQVASIVGPVHQVDLKSYDLLILVEIYKVRLADLHVWGSHLYDI